MPLWARALLAAEPPPPGPHEQGGAAAAGAAAAAAASQSVACFAGPWGSDCFIEQGEVGGSGQHNATMVSANGCGGNASGDGCAPISRTVLAVASEWPQRWGSHACRPASCGGRLLGLLRP
jgi:hypothetical protein